MESLKRSLQEYDPVKLYGRIQNIVGLFVESEGPASFLGELCYILPDTGVKHNGGVNGDPILAEVVGFRGNKVVMMPFGELAGVSVGSKVRATGRFVSVKVGEDLVGRVLDGLGNPIDGKGPVLWECELPIYRSSPQPLERRPIQEVLPTGVKAIDALLTVGKGQRIGIFSGSGVGKSTLLGMIARYAKADINVIALVGERGREVREFIEKNLGEDGLKKSIVVVATSDMPAVLRKAACFVAMTIAEYFRDKGLDVLFMMDSVTRFAMAQREIGISVGEPPTTRGYTPSVFSLLPRLLERAGTSEKGSITGIFTVLVEGSDMEEPVADAVRAILDGHIVLTRELASKAHYPAIDVLQSVSRLMHDIVDKEHWQLAARLKSLLAVYSEAEDLINIGAYKKGSNKAIDEAIEYRDKILSFLKQDVEEHFSFEETKELLKGIFS
ncbi:flagellar protein export ATPase FliI [Thermosulfidibacter takaii]|uniref:flagellar protein export ATPase FliI n=1 Tax=Thermosulfidibacter takaii TaxID=412593 RepID=UPI0011873F28